MRVKLLEIRDEGTFMPMLCVDMNPADSMFAMMAPEEYEKRRYLLRRCGYACDGKPNVAITLLDANGDSCSNDPHYWGNRTRQAAHSYIIDHWDELRDGDVVDVQFILGETTEPKKSERITAALAD